MLIEGQLYQVSRSRSAAVYSRLARYLLKFLVRLLRCVSVVGVILRFAVRARRSRRGPLNSRC